MSEPEDDDPEAPTVVTGRYATRDEAIAAVLRESQDLGVPSVVRVHDVACTQAGDPERECTCTPLVFTTGPEA